MLDTDPDPEIVLLAERRNSNSAEAKINNPRDQEDRMEVAWKY
jgi:hypothetical protein